MIKELLENTKSLIRPGSVTPGWLGSTGTSSPETVDSESTKATPIALGDMNRPVLFGGAFRNVQRCRPLTTSFNDLVKYAYLDCDAVFTAMTKIMEAKASVPVKLYVVSKPKVKEELERKMAASARSGHPIGNQIAERLSTESLDLAATIKMFAQHGELEEYGDHPVVDLLERPNPYTLTTFQALSDAFTIHEYCAGESFMLPTPKKSSGFSTMFPTELYLLDNPDNVTFYYDQFQQDVERVDYTDLQGRTHRYLYEDLIHYKRYNPINPMRGEPRLAGLRTLITTYNQMLLFNMRLAQNHFRPPGQWVKRDGSRVSSVGAQRVADEMNERYGGKNTGKPGVKQGDWEYVMYAIKPREAEFYQTMQRYRNWISVGIGVGSTLTGDESASTDNNKLHEAKALYTEVALPGLARMLSTLNKGLLPRYPMSEHLVLAYDPTGVEVLQEEISQAWDRAIKGYEKGLGFLSRDDARALVNLSTADDKESTENSEAD